jgi:hypothetical protein
VDQQLFWRAFGVQAAAVIVLFGVLVALPLPEDFFEDYGFVTGPIAWLACSFATGRILSLPPSFTFFCALASGIAGAIVAIATVHTAGLVAGVLVFGASCAGYDRTPESAPER